MTPPHPESAVLDLMRQVWTKGSERRDRTGVGTRALFGALLRVDLSDGRIPLLTTKRVFWKSAVKELVWFLEGSTNIRPLVEQGVHIWTDWPMERHRNGTGEILTRDEFEARILADEGFAAQWGELGPVYGKQWRRWLGPDGETHDQIAALLHSLKQNPASRRHIFTGWNVAELGQMALPPCHNGMDQWQGEFRTGWFDALSARYALDLVGGVDTLAIGQLVRLPAGASDPDRL